MSIDYRTGNLLAANAEALVNTVNCVGVMGKGIALQFKKAFPDNFKEYSVACERKEVEPGRMFITERPHHPRYIINFPTKRHWRARSRLSDVESGLAALAEEIRAREIRSVAIPALGCGHGGLEWEKVRSLIERMLGELSIDVQIVVFEPEGASNTKTMTRSVEAPEMTPGRAALVILMDRYLSGQLGKTRTLPEAKVHELMYFLQAAGEPLQLDYSKGSRGPRASDLRRALHKMEEHWISGYNGTRDEFGELLDLIPGASECAKDFLKNRLDTINRVDRLCNLIDGFEAPSGLELLATIHWLTHNGRPGSVADIIRPLQEKGFYRKQIEQAYQNLEDRGWLHDEEKSDRMTEEKQICPVKMSASADMASEQIGDDPRNDEPPTSIDINTAKVHDLEGLPRVGNKLAHAIVMHRDRHGPFHTIRSITQVPGIGDVLYRRIASRITVEGQLF